MSTSSAEEGSSGSEAHKSADGRGLVLHKLASRIHIPACVSDGQHAEYRTAEACRCGKGEIDRAVLIEPYELVGLHVIIGCERPSDVQIAACIAGRHDVKDRIVESFPRRKERIDHPI